MTRPRPASSICFALIASTLLAAPGLAQSTPDLWALAVQKKHVHQFSTLFTADQVRKFLSSDEEIHKAINWCRQTGVTKVYLETFRSAYHADRDTLLNAKRRFLDAGFDVSGCITTTIIGKRSTGWKELISCYTDLPTQAKLQSVFEFAAGLFDEVMIDDFWFTDCACPECDKARLSRTATVGDKVYPVAGDTWEDYRCELMVRLSQDRILAPARKVNPDVKLIIKYPQWYDRFHERGYEVARQTCDFDRTWVGTETRDYADKQWGGTPQYEAYFIMRWLGGIGGAKCGGGWYDPYGTTEHTYIEQARQTVLGGARESVLFCYGSLIERTGPRNIEVFRQHVPELLKAAEEVAKRPVAGVAAYKPANSHPGKEQRVFDFVGMLGVPLAPCHEFPTDAPAAFFSLHAMKDPEIVKKLAAFIATGKPVLITDGLAAKLEGKISAADAPNVFVLPVKGDPKSLLALPDEKVNEIRGRVLEGLDAGVVAPNRVGVYLFKDGSYVVENFNDAAVSVKVNGGTREIAARGWTCDWK